MPPDHEDPGNLRVRVKVSFRVRVTVRFRVSVCRQIQVNLRMRHGDEAMSDSGP